MSNNTNQTIRKRLLVNTAQERAYEVFTKKIDRWWPRTHHIGKTPVKEFILEPRLNGRWYSTHEDGSECEIGKVLVWEPPKRLVLAWQVNGQFQYVSSLITEIEIKFTPDGPNKTIVEFEHRDLERLGGGGKTPESMDAGWAMILELYAKEAAQQEKD
jgi:uncharacterized protein YndB with AHSA1/START domain